MEKIIGRNIEKSFGDRLLFSIPELKIEENEKIGIVGNNGTGKTTFLNIIAGKESVDKGKIEVNGSVSYMKQFDTVPTSYLSGGEKAKVAIAKLLVSDSNVLLLDEPTNFLDIPSLEALENLIQNFCGTVVFSTHDRQFVEKIATRVYEIEDKKIREGGKGEKIQQKKKNENELLLLKMKMAEISSKIAFEKEEKVKVELEEKYREM